MAGLLEAVNSMVSILGASATLPGVQILIATGQSILSSITAVIAANPLISIGIITVSRLIVYRPKIMDVLANWIADLRLAMHKLGKAWNAQIRELEKWLQ